MKSLKRNVCILFSALLATCCGAIGAGALKAQTAEAETTPTLTIESNNLSYSEYIYMLYAVSSDGFDRAENPIQLLFWEGEQTEYVYGTQDDSVATSGQATVKEKDCLVYYSRGLAAKEMTVDLYTRAYAEVDGVGYYSEIHKVSVVDYVYTMRENKALDEVTDSLFTEMLEYGAAAQLKFNFNTDKLANTPYYRVTVENGAFLDGNTTARFQEGESVTLVANPAPEGETFSHWKDELGSVVSTEATWEIEEITATKTYTAVYKSNGAGDIVGEKTVCATFTFGENGNATHEDGNEVSDGKAYTDGDYTLTLSGVSKVFGEARDAMGNSALKLGTSSVVGSFTFIVPEDVVSVDLHIAKYKVRESKITVNGGEAVVLTKNSDDGEYDVITVDTSEIKTVTVSTATGATRVMVNTVVWYRLEETVSASEGLAYTLNEDGESYSVTGIGECTDTDIIIIPSAYEGKPVTAIGAGAFQGCTSFSSITIPTSVQKIGGYAFYESSVTSVVLEEADSWNKLTYTYTAPNEYGAEETTTYTYDLSNAEKAAAALKGGVKLCTSGEYRGEEDETGLPILTYYYTTFTWYNTTWTRTQEV